jgi:hypothetical protein
MDVYDDLCQAKIDPDRLLLGSAHETGVKVR